MRYKFWEKECENLSEALNELHREYFDLETGCYSCPLKGLRCDLENPDIPDDERERLLQLAHIEAIPNDDDIKARMFGELAQEGSAQTTIHKAECMCKSENETRGKRRELPIMEDTIMSEPFMKKNLYLDVNFNLVWEVGDPTEAGRYLCICGIPDKGRVSEYMYDFVYFNPEFGWDFYVGEESIICAWAENVAKPTTEDIIYGGTIGE